MARNEEQFYGMFKEAFRDFTPEAPAHVFEGVKANLGMERSLTGSRSLWAGVLVLLLGSGAVWLYLNSSKSELAATPGAMSANVNGAIYKAHWSIGLEESDEEMAESNVQTMQVAVSVEPALRNESAGYPSRLLAVASDLTSSPEQEDQLEPDGNASPEESPAPITSQNNNLSSGNPSQDSVNANVAGAPLNETPDTVEPETRKFVIQGKKTITIEEE